MTELVPPTGLRLSGHTFLGRGPRATGRDDSWHVAGHAFRCARCGDFIPAGRVEFFSCRCGALCMDPDYLRLGSSLGDRNVLVYRPSARTGARKRS
jgi:hypothetical protein